MKQQDTTRPSDWVETTLGEVCEVVMGQSPKGETYNLDDNGLPFYQGVTEFDEKYVKIKTYTSEPTKIIEPNTILFSVRAPVGRVNFTKHKSCIGRGNAGLKMYNGNQEFLFHLLKFLERQIQNRTSGTVFTSISGKELKEIPITIPINSNEQKAIASVLSAFDDKIELLREQNKTLEEMGQTIFKEWFGKYGVDDELPEGWRVGKLGEELETFLGGTPSKEKIEFWENGSIPWVNSGKINEFRIIEPSEYITEEALKKSATKLLPKGTVVIAITGATLGQYSRLEIDCCFNQSVVGIKENEKINSSYIYFWIAENIGDIIRNATGGAHQHINKENVNQTNFLIPPQEILEKFYKSVDPIMQKISDNMFQTQSLARSRDELLPKLMSGYVRVNGFE